MDGHKGESLFDRELSAYIAGQLPKDHIFSLGLPGEILCRCGFPEKQRIEMSASRLEFKARLQRHPFDLRDVAGLDGALQSPVAVFDYGDRNRAQNVVVGMSRDGKNFLAGIHFSQRTRGYEVSDIRTLYPKENTEWLNWINQGKMIYGRKERIQALVAQQRMNGAEVSGEVVQGPLHGRCLDSILMILEKFGPVNDIFTDGHAFYRELAEISSIEQKFFAFYTGKGNLDARTIAHVEAEELWTALKDGNESRIREYTETDLHEISGLAQKIAAVWKQEHTGCIEEEKPMDLIIKGHSSETGPVTDKGNVVKKYKGATYDDSHEAKKANNKKTSAPSVLTEPMNIRIGKAVFPCRKGILAGFKNAVRCMAMLVKENKRLKDELDRLTRNRRDGRKNNPDNMEY